MTSLNFHRINVIYFLFAQFYQTLEEVHMTVVMEVIEFDGEKAIDDVIDSLIWVDCINSCMHNLLRSVYIFYKNIFKISTHCIIHFFINITFKRFLCFTVYYKIWQKKYETNNNIMICNKMLKLFFFLVILLTLWAYN